MAQQLEETLGKLLVPDNNTIQAATQQLKELFKDPNIIPGLCQVLSSSQTPQVRQYAAVLLRRKIQKSRQWRALPENISSNIRENILQLLLQEPEKIVRNAVAQVAATVAKHDLPSNQWPQLFQFLLAYTKSQNSAEREIGMFVLYTVSAAAAEQLKPHLVSVLQLLAEVINDTENKLVPYYSIRTMTELIFYIGDDEMKYIQGVIPRILQVVKELITIDEDQACEALEVFDEMLECEVAILVPHIKPVMDFCLEIIPNVNLSDSVRVKAMSFVASLVKLKKKAFLKHKFVNPVLHTIFPVMCAEDDDDGIDEEEDENESQTPARFAPQVIDSMALHLPPDKLIPNLMSIVEPAIVSDKPSLRRASYIGLAVVAEGCADYITNKHLQAVLQCVVKGLNDPDHTVRNTALFALGQFSEHLQPDISKFASELLPLLFQYLGRATQEAEKNPRGLTKSYYALEMFCENLGKDILPYMPALMEHLLNVLKTPTSNRMKELAISAIGAAANAAKDGIKPYFQEIIVQFKGYLTAPDDEELRKLQIQALDTLGVLARTVGEDTFLPLAKECAQLGINLLQSVDDPDLRRCVYGLFAALSSLLKSETGPYLEVLVTHMMGSLKSTEGVKAHFKEAEEQVSVFNEEDFCDEEDLTGEEEDDDDDDNKIEGISVENAFLDEKEDTCCALGEIAGNTGPIFFPFLDQSFQEVFDMLEYPADGIKKSAITAVGLMCVCVHKTNTEAPSPESHAVLGKMITTVIPKLIDIIKEDKDRVVVMTAIDTISDMLEKIGLPVIQTQGYADAILTKMKEIFTHKLPCQDQDTEEEDEEQAEFDGMLIESAGDTLPKVAKLIGGENFLPFFTSFLTDLLKRLKESSAISERSFAVGTLAEIIEACGWPCAVPFVEQLYPLFIKMIHDSDEEVRSNSVFALGVLIANSQDKLFPRFPEVLKCLFDILNKESNVRVLDNICAATCRMIMANKPGVPMEHVVPVIMQCLPLKEDFEENSTVYTCLLHQYGAADPEVLKHLSKLLVSTANVLGTEQIKSEEQHLLIQFVKDVNQKYPQDYQAVRTSLPADIASKLDTCITATNGTA